MKSTKVKKIFLFFFVHPSKFHVFRSTINYLIRNGHKVDILITSKDVLEKLVKEEGWDYTNIFPEGRKMTNIPALFSAVINTIRTVYRLYKYTKDKKYDLFITDDLLVINGKFNNTPTIHLQDDDITAVPESRLILYFASYILSPHVSNLGKYEKKKIPFFGYKELGSLHPNVFKPDYSVVEKFNPAKKPYVILRLVKLKSTHDFGKSGLSNTDIDDLIERIHYDYSLYITSERKLPAHLEKYRISINPNKIAHALYFAKLLVSDSQTMSAEAGVLGTPYIRYNDFVDKISYLSELENIYKLGIGIKTEQKSLLFETVDMLLKKNNLREEWHKKRQKMLKDKIDLSSFMIWLFENYPQSIKILKENPEYQKRFK